MLTYELLCSFYIFNQGRRRQIEIGAAKRRQKLIQVGSDHLRPNPTILPKVMIVPGTIKRVSSFYLI